MELLESMTHVVVLIGYLVNCQDVDWISGKYIEKVIKKKPKDNINSRKNKKLYRKVNLSFYMVQMWITFKYS